MVRPPLQWIAQGRIAFFSALRALINHPPIIVKTLAILKTLQALKLWQAAPSYDFG